MKKRLKFTLLILVAAPMVLQLWMVQRLVSGNSMELKEEYSKIRLQKLQSLEYKLTNVVNRVAEDLRKKGNDSAYSKLSFVTFSNGNVFIPNSYRENFYEKTAEVWRNNRFLNEVIRRDFGEGKAKSNNEGWWRAFSGSELKLYFWQKKNGKYRLNQVNYAALLADLIAVLPDGNGLAEQWSFRGIDKENIYSWGKFFKKREKLTHVEKICEFEPFNGFLLQISLDEESLPENRLAASFQQNIYYLAGVMAIVFVILAVYFYRTSSREFREAESKVSFVNRVSHELKTPLANIRLYSELMSEKAGENEEYLRYLQVINSESGRLSRLIHNILTFSKQKRGTAQLRMQRVDFDGFFEDFLEPMTFPLKQKGFEVILENNCHNSCKMDGDLVKQVLGNLVSNVEKYAVDGKYLRVQAKIEQEFLKLTVEDRGEGIPKRCVSHIFKPFYRCDNRNSAGVSGSGIGLTISRELAELHGGTIKFENLEKGCRFEVIFKVEVFSIG